MSYVLDRELPHSHRFAGWSALATTILFGIGNALWVFDQPGFGASGGHLVRFYREGSGRIVTGALLSLVSFALFLVFASAFRVVLVELEEDELHANMAFAGVLMVVAAGFGAEGINMAAALRAADGHLSEILAQALFETSYVFGYNAAGIGLGVLSVAVGAAALRARALLPRWLAAIAVVLGVLLLTPLSRYLLVAGFVLVGVVGYRLLQGTGVHRDIRAAGRRDSTGSSIHPRGPGGLGSAEQTGCGHVR
jgi:MFS family permease